MYERLLAVGITTRGACSDSVRNVTGLPVRGRAPRRALRRRAVLHGRPRLLPLQPAEPDAAAQVQDRPRGLRRATARRRRSTTSASTPRCGTAGAASRSGPAAGSGSQPFLAQHHRRLHPGRGRARLVRGDRPHAAPPRRAQEPQPGAHEVRREEARHSRLPQPLVEDEVARVEAERGDELRAEVRERVASHAVPPAAACAGERAAAARARASTHWQRTNVRPQRQAGTRRVIVQLPLGDITSDQMRAVGRARRGARQRDAARHQRPEPRRALGRRGGAAGGARGAGRRSGSANADAGTIDRRRVVPGHGLLLAGDHALDGRGGAHPRPSPRRSRHGQRLRGAARRLRRSRSAAARTPAASTTSATSASPATR